MTVLYSIYIAMLTYLGYRSLKDAKNIFNELFKIGK